MTKATTKQATSQVKPLSTDEARRQGDMLAWLRQAWSFHGKSWRLRTSPESLVASSFDGGESHLTQPCLPKPDEHARHLNRRERE